MSKELLSKLNVDLKLAGYAKRSCQSYVRAVRQLMNYCMMPLHEIAEQQVREYWIHCKDELDWSGATMRISYSGIKFFFQHTLKRDWETLRLLKIKRQVTPPTVLSVDEVRQVLAALPTSMNQAFYTTVYTLGLRLGEARHLSPAQIDAARMCVEIRDAKGDDRLIPLPESTLLLLREWWKTHRNPQWIFPAPGRDGKQASSAVHPVAEGTVQGALRRTSKKLKISKHVHPHLHFVIPGGGLSKSRDKWISANGNFLVHVRALSKMFRGKLQKKLTAAGLLDQAPGAVWSRRDWVVHCKAVGDGRHTMKYLGAYVFRVAISAARVVAYDGRHVRFKYQKVGSSKWRFMTLEVMEFMRRFLQHVLPKGFVKVRHFGFMSPNFSVPIQKIRELICMLYELLRHCPVRVKPPKQPKPLECPRCQAGMVWRRFIPPVRWAPS